MYANILAMSNYCILRTQKIKSMSDLRLACQHNSRERVPINADPNIAQNDRILTFIDNDPINDPIYQNKHRKGAVLAVEWLLTASDMSDIDLKSWAKDNINFVASKMGGMENIARADLHLDEKTPHLHIITIPKYENKLNCKKYLGGNKWVMRDLQDEYADEMGTRYGLCRGIPKTVTKSYHIKSGNLNELEEIKKQKKQLLQNWNLLQNDNEKLKNENELLKTEKEQIEKDIKKLKTEKKEIESIKWNSQNYDGSNKEVLEKEVLKDINNIIADYKAGKTPREILNNENIFQINYVQVLTQ